MKSSPEISTINEIRTERLSRALQKMRKKSISVCAMRDTTTIKVNVELAPPAPFAEKSPMRKAYLLEKDSSSESSDDPMAYFRRRTSSVPVIKEMPLLKPHSYGGRENEEEEQKLIPAIHHHTVANRGASGTWRFVKQLLHRRADPHVASRTRTMATISDRKEKSTPIASVVRLRTQTSVQPASVCSNRGGAHYGYGSSYQQGAGGGGGSSCSKSSSGVSSRCHSPMRFSTMLNLPTSEPVSPATGAFAASLAGHEPSCSTILVIGSEGVGKGDLIEMFLQSDARKTSSSLELGYDVEDLDSIITLIIDNEEAHVRFVEVNNEKNDLWPSLSASARVVMYHTDDAISYRNALDVIRKLRECHDQSPVFLVSNMSCDRVPCLTTSGGTYDVDARHAAKQLNCKHFEINTSNWHRNRAIDELLASIVRQIRSHSSVASSRHSHHPRQGLHKRGDNIVYSTTAPVDSPIALATSADNGSHFDLVANGFFHLRTWSAGSNSSSQNGGKQQQPSPSLCAVRQKLFANKRKQKQCSEDAFGDGGTSSCTNIPVGAPPTIHKYFGTDECRRESMSLENLASSSNDRAKKTMCK